MYKYILTHMSMKKYDPKTRLTVTIDKDVLRRAKKVAEEKRIPVSRLVENFLKFFSEPYVYCFKCGERFEVKEAELCPKCGWMICPKCKACGCNLSRETSVAVFYMRKVCEELFLER